MTINLRALSDALASCAEAGDANNYDSWSRVGLALAHAVAEGSVYKGDAQDLFHEFSKNWPDFDDAKFQQDWAGFLASGGKSTGNPLTVASIFHRAKELGWALPKPIPGEYDWIKFLPEIEQGDPAPYFSSIKQVDTPPESWLYQNGTLCTYQDIKGNIVGAELFTEERDAQGKCKKKLLPGSSRIGSFILIWGLDSSTETVYIGEGVATMLAVGAALPVSTEKVAILAAGSKNNLPNVAKDVRAEYPEALIILVADRDATGHCENLARSVPGVKVATVPVDFQPDNRSADFWDLYNEKQDEAVLEQLKKARFPVPEGSSTPRIPPLASLRVANLITSVPPPRRWIIERFLPLGVLGLLIAAGGTGKSFLGISMGVAVAAGVPFAGGIGQYPYQCAKYGFDPTTPRAGVFMLASEDDLDEIHRRVCTICQAYLQGIEESRPEFSAELIENSKVQFMKDVGENLYILPATGKSNLLVSKGQPTPLVTELISRAEEINNLKLMILDPLSRLHDGDENDSGGMTRVVEVLETIKHALDVTVLVMHHTNKAAILNGTKSSAAGRGSSALVDGSRWVAQLVPMSESEGKKLDIEDCKPYVSLSLVKTNYCKIITDIWLKRGEDGVLAREYLGNTTTDGFKLLTAVQDKVAELVKSDNLHSCDGFTKAFSGKSGLFGMGRQALSGVVHQAIKEKLVKQVAAGDLGDEFSSAKTQKKTTLLLVRGDYEKQHP